MKLLEYEAKAILKQSSIPVPTSEQIDRSTDPSLPAVLKSQVPVGGRGKAGGVRLVKSAEEAKETLAAIFDLEIRGYKPRVILAEEPLDIDKEFYISLLIDRDSSSIQLLANKTGGIEVEENTTESFLREIVNIGTDFNTLGEKVAEYYDLPDQTFALQDLVKNLYDCFVKNDATLIEINPLALTTEGELIAGDCKMELDDAAKFRHPEWNFEYTPADSNFVTLHEDGTVATIANGAGLAMATVDAVADAGLIPANFLDIGGGANEAGVLAAFEKIVTYPNVSAIVINIFAGITRCDEVARAVIAATKHIKKLPKLYIRLAGTNYEEAEILLREAGIGLQPTLATCLAAVKKDML
ncbi:MAG: ATP-grasp domain-containing protein [Candidatus Saccharimonadales bacterium]